MTQLFRKLYAALKTNVTVFMVCGLAVLMPINTKAVETTFWVDSQFGVAAGGYDPISFFLKSGAQRGQKIYEYYWGGAVWRFINEGNLVAFKNAPFVYSPQFGGFDASKMAANLKVSPDPKYSDLYENRLYFFHSERSLKEWKGNKRKFLIAAQENWTKLNIIGLSKNFKVQKIQKAKISEFKTASAALYPEEPAPAKSPKSLPGKKKIESELPEPSLTGSQRLGAAGKHFKKKK